VGIVREPGGTSDSLSGADGTQLPDPMPVFPDSLTAPAVSSDPNYSFEPVGVPALPDERAMRAAIAAALGDDPAGQAGRATPKPPGGSPGQRPSSRAGAGQQRQVSRPTQVGPAGSARAQRSGPSGAYQPVAPADLRRRISRDMAGSMPSGWKPGGCIIALVVLGLVVFSFLAGFVESLARLLQ
jgi:hypothetical protein